MLHQFFDALGSVVGTQTTKGTPMNPLTPDEVMARHAKFEQECVEQARRELAQESEGNPYACRSAIQYIRQLITRAQEVKARRKAAGENF